MGLVAGVATGFATVDCAVETRGMALALAVGELLVEMFPVSAAATTHSEPKTPKIDLIAVTFVDLIITAITINIVRFATDL